MNANAFVHWGLGLASDILEICKEGKAAAIVDAIDNGIPSSCKQKQEKWSPGASLRGIFCVEPYRLGE